MKRHRKAEVKRKTKETEVYLKIDLDGVGKHSISTGIPFFDHMLRLFAYHSRIDLSLKAKGDIGVDTQSRMWASPSEKVSGRLWEKEKELNDMEQPSFLWTRRWSL